MKLAWRNFSSSSGLDGNDLVFLVGDERGVTSGVESTYSSSSSSLGSAEIRPADNSKDDPLPS